MSAFTTFLATHAALANSILGGEQILYTPRGGTGFFVTGIIKIGDAFEQGQGPYAAALSNVLDSQFTSVPALPGFVPTSGDSITRANGISYDIYHVGNVDEAGTRVFLLREAR